MTAYDPRRGVESSSAATVRASVERLSDSALVAHYRETGANDHPSRSTMVEAVYRRALTSSRVRRSIAATRRADRDRKRRARSL